MASQHQQRWERLRETLVNAGYSPRLHERPFQDSGGGGVSRSISIRLNPPGAAIEVTEKWWRKNDKVWLGYEVAMVNAEGIEEKVWPLTKKRSEVRANVTAAGAIYRARGGGPLTPAQSNADNSAFYEIHDRTKDATC